MKAKSLRAAMILSLALFALVPAVAPMTAGASAAASVLPSFSDLVKKAQPAVVTVKVASSGTPAPATRGKPLPDDPALRDFMERFFGRGFGGEGQPPQRQRRAQGLGSGFIIDASGLIVTNNHVIDGADTITIVLQNGDELEGNLVGRDKKTDLAVIRVEADAPLPTVPWGDSDAVEVGDWAIAIGNPFGLGGSVSAGIVSARGRDIRSGPYDDFIQVDAAINRGNSGGPLFDQEGNVIGVNTAIYSPSGGNVGIGFAIPSNLVREVVADLINGGTVERGWLGVSIQPVTDEIAGSLGLAAAEGALIARVTEDSPAEEAGLKTGDVILAFGEDPVETLRDLTRAVAGADPGTKTTVTVWRGGEARELALTTGRMPGERQAAAALPPPAATGSEFAALGLTVLSADQGLAVADVDPASDAASKGVRPGDVIVSANQEPIDSVGALENVVAQAREQDRKSVLLLVAREGGQRFVTVELGRA
ncbi:MAG: Do family serine endopeptidase [Paracoccaceae bacterium]|nr:Do family serine endopeptidase [Paracoccaceae bacterium]